MNLITKEIKIALVAIAGVIALFFGMSFLKGLSLFGNKNTYHIEPMALKLVLLQVSIMTTRHNVNHL